MNYNLYEPILLNSIKHHAGYIQNEINSSQYDPKILRKKLVVIGDSQMDLYFGSLSPVEIGDEVIKQLKENMILEKTKYESWLESGRNDYQTITLSDTSVWTLRLAEDEERYVHIHPGRYSPHTIRVKALTLKTAIAVLVYAARFSKHPIDVEVINLVRSEILGESPVKSLEKSEGLIKLLTLLSEKTK
ncbi:hypothetical protein ACFLTH_11455 [Bacteroidota bacterium]